MTNAEGVLIFMCALTFCLAVSLGAMFYEINHRPPKTFTVKIYERDFSGEELVAHWAYLKPGEQPTDLGIEKFRIVFDVNPNDKG